MAKEQTSSSSGVTERADESLRCAACDHRITERAYRIEQNGAHQHTFVNPAGVVFEIGCFALAPGCVHLGDVEHAFTWFPGWKWQVAVCARCRTHLGWIYRLEGEQFHGLILAALRG
ncbi:MAG: cereblon family protein [Kofleriaceae bacterium]